MALQPTNNEGLRELALFAGAGGGILGGKLLGWRTVCAVEYAAYPRSVLLARQRDGFLEPFPIWDDVRTFDGKPWRGKVDVVSGGFPCQDISAAGNGAGLDGERSGLWKEMARIIGEVGPNYAFIENSPMLAFRGLNRVLADLATMGFNARWGVLGSHHTGIPTERERMWILASRHGLNLHWHDERKRFEEYHKKWRTAPLLPCNDIAGRKFVKLPSWLPMDNGMADWVDEIKAIGNGQVPAVVRLAWETLKP